MGSRPTTTSRRSCRCSPASPTTACSTDIDATLAHLHDAGFADGQIGIVGFCFGGRVTFLVSLRRAIGAGVGFYGGGITHDSQGMAGPLVGEAASLQTPWLGLFGDDDQMIPVAGVEDLRVDAGRASRCPTEICRYEGAGHGFHCDARDSYHEPSAEDGWRAHARLVRHAPRLTRAIGTRDRRHNLYRYLGSGPFPRMAPIGKTAQTPWGGGRVSEASTEAVTALERT